MVIDDNNDNTSYTIETTGFCDKTNKNINYNSDYSYLL